MQNALSTKAGRLFTFGTLYIAEGVPLGFTATAMAAYMRREGLDVSQIGAFVGMLYLPWGLSGPGRRWSTCSGSIGLADVKPGS